MIELHPGQKQAIPVYCKAGATNWRHSNIKSDKLWACHKNEKACRCIQSVEGPPRSQGRPTRGEKVAGQMRPSSKKGSKARPTENLNNKRASRVSVHPTLVGDRTWDFYYTAMGTTQAEVRAAVVNTADEGSSEKVEEVNICHICTDEGLLYGEMDVHCEASRLHKKGQLFSQINKDFLASLSHKDYLEIVSNDPGACFKWGHVKLCEQCRK